MDSIFYIGESDGKLPQFLERLGYAVLTNPTGGDIGGVISRAPIDLIVVDAQMMDQGPDLCAFLRTQDSTKSLPIVYITTPKDTGNEELALLDKVDVVTAPVSVGGIAGRIATRLRLSKIAGRDELKGTLVEMNASLRELTKRFEREMKEAREIQESLLPRQMPSAEGLQMAVSYKPVEELGGDWYFAEKVGDGRIRLQIADVTGHGLSAAFISSMVKLAMCAVDVDSPHLMLRDMNRLLSQQIPQGRFVTVGACVYDPGSGALQWARAGHPPALVYRSDTGGVERLVGDGFGIGFVPDAEYSLVETVLHPGDAILLYTDGISEALNRAGAAFGVQGLAESLSRVRPHLTCSAILNSILDDFDAFREERAIKDDITLVVLKRLAVTLPD